MAVSSDKEEVGVLAVRFLCVGNGEVGAVEAGSSDDLTVNRGYLAHPQSRKISSSGVLALPTGILEGIREC